MNNGGDVAEQMFRMSLEGTEFALKIAGKGAKHIAVLLYTILSQQKKTKGHVSLSNMLKTSEKTFMYSIQKTDMRKFIERAKAYGVKYHVCLQDKNKTVHLMTDEKSVARIDRIIQELEIANVDINKITREIEREKTEKSQQSATKEESKSNEKALPENLGNITGKEPDAVEKGVQEKSPEDKLLDAIFSKPTQAEKQAQENDAGKTDPFRSAAEKSRPSEPISGKQSKEGKGIMSRAEPSAKSGRTRVSVRKELKEIGDKRKAQDTGKAAVRNTEARSVPPKSKGKGTR